MDGRWLAVILTLVVPGVLIAVTVGWYSSNPLALLALFAVILGGALYLLSYAESFAARG